MGSSGDHAGEATVPGRRRDDRPAGSRDHGGQSSGKRPAALVLAALGVVCGVIGTSPLYAFREVFAGSHPVPVSEAGILGSLSLFFWALIVVVSLKYVIFVTRADNRGEGGIVALTARALHVVQNRPGQARGVMLVGMLGGAMFWGSGMVAPALSVLAAAEGLEVAAPVLTPLVLPVTLLALLGLSLIQRRGTAIVDNYLGPVMLLWFAVLALLGVHNIVAHPAILKAFNPLYGIEFLFAGELAPLAALGCVVLATAGAEVLIAGMGPFGLQAVLRAWFAGALPALVLNYFGQGALILATPAATSNPFFLSAPDWALYPLIVLALLAALIATQAVIAGAFSVTRQGMLLGFVPRMEVERTADGKDGRAYLPAVNWGLIAVVVILVLGFRSSHGLAAAYAIAVTGEMIATSLLCVIVAARVWKWGWGRAATLFGCFLALELLFLAGSLVKVPAGGWFPLVVGAGFFVLMTTWRRGRELFAKRLKGECLELAMFVESLASSMPTRVAGTSVFMNADPKSVPHALLHNLMHNKVLHERVVVVAVQFPGVPSVPDSSRVQVRCLRDSFWSVVIQFGFRDEPDVPRALGLCADKGLVFDALGTSFYLGSETLIPRLDSEMPLWQERLFVALFSNASSAAAFFRIPSNRVIEVGTQVVL